MLRRLIEKWKEWRRHWFADPEFQKQLADDDMVHYALMFEIMDIGCRERKQKADKAKANRWCKFSSRRRQLRQANDR